MPISSYTSYDELPYDSYAFRDTHPDVLATMASLFGLPAPAVDTCRVLELGCAAGGNLLPLAQSLPSAQCVGVDLSIRQIEQGRATALAAGLANVTLVHEDIANVDRGYGEFDYIVCHGVYSWVPESVQTRILEICRECLAPNGVAYVSYNTFPGWHLRASVREMMTYHARQFDDTATRIEQARALLDFLVQATPGDGSAYGQLLHDELQILRDRRDTYLFHEHLERHNTPLYFHEFMARAERAGLRYLSEATLESMLANAFAPDVQATLHRIAPDIIRMEQYLDFLRNRMFRRTLLCHAGVELSRYLGPQSVRACRVTSELVAEDVTAPIDIDAEWTFKHPQGTTVTVRTPIEKAALAVLADAAPASLDHAALLDRARARLASHTERDAAVIAEMVLGCYTAGAVSLRLAPDRFTLDLGEFPRATALARVQAANGTAVTNQRHETLTLGPLDLTLLPLLDGRNDRSRLTDAFVDAVLNGSLVLNRGEQQLVEETEIRALADDTVEVSLQALAARMLIVG